MDKKRKYARPLLVAEEFSANSFISACDFRLYKVEEDDIIIYSKYWKVYRENGMQSGLQQSGPNADELVPSSYQNSIPNDLVYQGYLYYSESFEGYFAGNEGDEYQSGTIIRAKQVQYWKDPIEYADVNYGYLMLGNGAYVEPFQSNAS